MLGKTKYHLRTMAKRLLPAAMVDLLRYPGQAFRSKVRASRRDSLAPVPKERMMDDLRHAGIRAGETIMVHSSLSRIGNVVGGPQAVVESLIDVVTDAGTLVMPCYTSAERVIRDFKRGKIVDLRDLPSGTGIITETFRTFPDVRRSSHPFSSVCAWGKQAEYITAGHADHSEVCHETSPIGRLLASKGKVVGIGISIAQGLGIAHYIEDTYDGFPFEVHSDPIELTYIDASGNRVTRSISRYDPRVARTRIDYPDGAWIEAHLTMHLERVGILERFKFGEADSWIMEVEPLYHELIRLADKGITMYLTEDDLTDANRSCSSW